MIEFRGVSLQRGGRWLFRDVAFKIFPGWKTGVIGANGCGKSSLLGLLTRALEVDAGAVLVATGARVVALAQETPWTDVSALDFVLDGDAELRSVEQELSSLELGGCGKRIATLHDRLDTIDGYTAPARAAQILAGLGFSEPDQRRPVTEFSGGWRMRLALAQVLMARSDILILDEPTNHLDLDAVLWLQSWLNAYRGTLILVSHDRELLDGSTNHTLGINAGVVRLLRGNYSAYEQIRVQELAQQSALGRKQQLERERLGRFIDRFRAKATKAKQVQSRLKALDRLGKVSLAHADTGFRFELKTVGPTPDPMLTLDDVSFGYAQQPVLDGANLVLRAGSRIGLLGPNGAGKSTLMRVLAGLLEPRNGVRTLAPGVKIGYLAQHQMEQLDPDLDAAAHLRHITPDVSEARARDHLGGFGFSGERALEPVDTFSGGEKARLALALMVWHAPALLLLDEPTNHLDLEVRHALTVALQAFEGAMVLVSHDRYLLRACCDSFLMVSADGLVEFEGDLGDYDSWLTDQRRSEQSVRPSAGPRGKNRRRESAKKRLVQSQQRRPLEHQLKQLEERMDTLGRERETLQTQLSDQSLYAEARSEELQETMRSDGLVTRELETVETEWLRVSEALESFDRP